MFKKIKSKIHPFTHQWNILVNMDNKISTSFSKFQEITPPKDRFWADPFVIYKKQQHHVFFEEFFHVVITIYKTSTATTYNPAATSSIITPKLFLKFLS